MYEKIIKNKEFLQLESFKVKLGKSSCKLTFQKEKEKKKYILIGNKCTVAA